LALQLGQTLFNAEALDVARHPWIIASDPEKADRVVLVNLSTKPCGTPPECIIEPKEHGALSRPSYIRFNEARLRDLSKLEAALKKGLFQPSGNLSPEILKKVQAALLASPLTPREVKELLKKQGLPA